MGSIKMLDYYYNTLIRDLGTLVQHVFSQDYVGYNSEKWYDENYVFYHKAYDHLVAIKMKQWWCENKISYPCKCFLSVDFR